jgi:hypothetical protein
VYLEDEAIEPVYSLPGFAATTASVLTLGDTSMGLFPPVYTYEELDKLDEEKRNELRRAILKALQEDRQIRDLLKKKTEDVYQRLIK